MAVCNSLLKQDRLTAATVSSSKEFQTEIHLTLKYISHFAIQTTMRMKYLEGVTLVTNYRSQMKNIRGYLSR